MHQLSFSLFDTAIGRCGLVSQGDGICGSQLPEEDPRRIRARLVRLYPGAREAPPSPAVARAITRVQGLLEGAPDDLRDLALDMSRVPAFDREVYQIVRTLSPGRTATYGDIARRLRRPDCARAVGRALGRNPFAPIVPCHRVVAAAGRLGGFSAVGGRSLKSRMLAAEAGWMIGDLFSVPRSRCAPRGGQRPHPGTEPAPPEGC